MPNCTCKRCRYVPKPKVIGDAHGVAVILHLDAESAHNLAGHLDMSDTGWRELWDAVTAWEAERDMDAEG